MNIDINLTVCLRETRKMLEILYELHILFIHVQTPISVCPK